MATTLEGIRIKSCTTFGVTLGCSQLFEKFGSEVVSRCCRNGEVHNGRMRGREMNESVGAHAHTHNRLVRMKTELVCFPNNIISLGCSLSYEEFTLVRPVGNAFSFDASKRPSPSRPSAIPASLLRQGPRRLVYGLGSNEPNPSEKENASKRREEKQYTHAFWFCDQKVVLQYVLDPCTSSAGTHADRPFPEGTKERIGFDQIRQLPCLFCARQGCA